MNSYVTKPLTPVCVVFDVTIWVALAEHAARLAGVANDYASQSASSVTHIYVKALGVMGCRTVGHCYTC